MGAHANSSFVTDLRVFLHARQDSKGDSTKLISNFVDTMRALGITVTVN